MSRLILALAFATAVAGAQGSAKSPLKKFEPPKILPIVDPIVAKDEGCARDFAKALFAMDGLERQKYIADLVIYGCIQRRKGTFDVKLTAIRSHKFGNTTVQIDGVELLGPYIVGQTMEITSGWVLDRQLLSTATLRTAIEAAIASAEKEQAKK